MRNFLKGKEQSLQEMTNIVYLDICGEMTDVLLRHHDVLAAVDDESAGGYERQQAAADVSSLHVARAIYQD